jgi:transketolase
MKLRCDTYEDTRKAYGETLVELGGERQDIVVLDADLSSSTQTHLFAKKYPDRFFNAGVAEQNLMGLSAGLALSEKTVFTSAFAMFGAGRAWEQIRNTIAYDNLNVKIVLTHAGITVGKDGSSHQIIEDLALMRVIPNMKVQVPADACETRALIRRAAEYSGPVYIRLTREKSLSVFDDYDFPDGKAIKIMEGSDVSILACGYMLAEAIEAGKKLSERGISASVINVNTIKPLDEKSILHEAKTTGALVTCEEHSIVGGLGGVVSELLCEKKPSPLVRIGIKDVFGKSGSPKDLMKRFEITSDDIVDAALKSMELKK